MNRNEDNDAVAALFREMNQDMGLMTPLEGVPPGMDSMWIQPSTAAPVPVPKPKRKRVRSRPKPPSAVEKVTTCAEVAPSRPIQWDYLGDPKDYVMDVFDKLIAPSICAANSVMTTMRQHIFRRAVGEFANADLKERASRGKISLEDLVAVSAKSCEKVGISFKI